MDGVQLWATEQLQGAQYTQDVNGTYIKHSKDVLDVF